MALPEYVLSKLGRINLDLLLDDRCAEKTFFPTMNLRDSKAVFYRVDKEKTRRNLHHFLGHHATMRVYLLIPTRQAKSI